MDQTAGFTASSLIVRQVARPTAVKFANDKEVAEARDMATEMALATGFDKIDCAQVALAVSEIAGNALKFAGKGTLIMRLTDNRKGLEISVQDKGQGLENVKKVLEEGYSSVIGSLGIGLNAATRAMDELSIKSKIGQGSTVIMKKYLAIPAEEIEYGIISVNDPRYPVNGDAYVIHEFAGDKTLLAVIDGTGNGCNANLVATFVKEIIEENYKSSLLTIATRCHKRMRKEFPASEVRSCVMGLLLLKPRSLEYLGVGDTTADVMATSPPKYISTARGDLLARPDCLI